MLYSSNICIRDNETSQQSHANNREDDEHHRAEPGSQGRRRIIAIPNGCDGDYAIPKAVADTQFRLHLTLKEKEEQGVPKDTDPKDRQHAEETKYSSLPDPVHQSFDREKHQVQPTYRPADSLFIYSEA